MFDPFNFERKIFNLVFYIDIFLLVSGIAVAKRRELLCEDFAN